MSSTTENLATARRYVRAVEGGATGQALAAFFTPDAIHEQLPNRLVPAGSRSNLAEMLAAADRGQQSTSRQRYDIRSDFASGNLVVMEVQWTGILKVPFGSIPAGGEMRADLAFFIEFEDGKIRVQREYACFHPW
ncbi:MAG: nuclear transport factor 2 family protein [Thermoanaerobaculia bacterium]